MFGFSWQTIATIFGVFGITIFGLLFGIIRLIRSAVNKKFEQEVKKTIGEAVQGLLPSLADRIVRDAQENILMLSQVLSLHAMRQYDEVLVAVGWEGNIEKLRPFNKKVRHCIIVSLYNCNFNSPLNRDSAWGALEDLFNEGHRDADTLELLLNIGISSKRYSETEEKISGIVDSEDNAKILVLVSTLYRKLGDPERAEKYARKAHDSKPSPDTALALSVLLRDQGQFDRANDILRPQILVLGKDVSGGKRQSEGWQRLFNTYIANKIDMGAEYDCISEALILSRYYQSPVEILTLGRYLLSLKKKLRESDRTNYDALLERVKSAAQQHMHENEAKYRCVSILEQLDGNLDGAIEKLNGFLRSNPEWLRASERAYLDCYLAAMYFDKGDVDAATRVAVSIQNHALVSGEAEYILAKCFAKRNMGPDAVLWLEKAIQRQGRWLSKARRNEVLAANVDVARSLAEYSAL